MYYKANPVVLYQTTNLKGYAQSILAKNETWLVILIALAVILLILLLVVVFLRSRITIAIALIREGSKYVLELYKLLFAIDIWIFRHDFNVKYIFFYFYRAVTSIKSTILFPIFPWIFQCAVIAYGILVLMFLMSIGESAFHVVNLRNDTTCDCGGVYTEVRQALTLY